MELMERLQRGDYAAVEQEDLRALEQEAEGSPDAEALGLLRMYLAQGATAMALMPPTVEGVEALRRGGACMASSVRLAFEEAAPDEVIAQLMAADDPVAAGDGARIMDAAVRGTRFDLRMLRMLHAMDARVGGHGTGMVHRVLDAWDRREVEAEDVQEALLLLLGMGADANGRTAMGGARTPLHRIVASLGGGRMEDLVTMAVQLRAYGARVDAVDALGRSVRDLCAEWHSEDEVARLLYG
jgi:hypothetical protein